MPTGSPKIGNPTPKMSPRGGSPQTFNPIAPLPMLTHSEIQARSLALLDTFSVLHFTAPNDRNGNPRRLWAAFTPAGQLVNAWEEGYLGTDAIPAAIRHKTATCYAVPITPAAYNAILRHARQVAAL